MPKDTSQKNLRSLLDSMDTDRLGREEFTTQFKKVIEIIRKAKQEMAEFRRELSSANSKFSAETKSKQDANVADLTSKVDKLISKLAGKLSAEHSERMLIAEDKMSLVQAQKGLDGRDGKDGSPDTGLETRDKLEKLTGDDRLDVNAIRGLKELLEEKTKDSGVQKFGGPGSVVNTGVKIETPSGTVDGSNKTFIAHKAPKYIIVDGVTYFEDNGFTISGKTVTTSVAPAGFIRSFY